MAMQLTQAKIRLKASYFIRFLIRSAFFWLGET